MRFSNSIVIIAISLFSVAAFANADKNGDVQIKSDGTISGNISVSDESDSGWKTLDDSLYTIKYPENWEMNYTGQFGLSFVVISPAEDASDKFRENISLVIQSMKNDDSSLEDFVGDNTAQIMEMIEDSKLLNNNESKIGNQVYREVAYSGKQNGLEIINTQRYFYHDGLAFVLTYTCQQGKQDKFNGIAKELIESIKLK